MNTGAKAGTIGGTLLSIFFNIPTTDYLRTAALAAVGAVVSFIVSILLREFYQWIRKNRDS